MIMLPKGEEEEEELAFPVMGERGNDFFWQMATLFKAYSSDVRLVMLEELRHQDGQISVSELVERLRERGYCLEQATISHHLYLLRHARLVDYKKHGLWSYYYLCRENFERAQQMLALYLSAPDPQER